MNTLIIDTETEGTKKESNILQLGAVAGNLENGQILGSFEVYHKLSSLEEYRIEPEAFEKHGIDAHTCFTKGITKGEIATKIADLYYQNNCVLIGGHNVITFDIAKISRFIFEFEPEDFFANFTYRVVDSSPVIRLFAGIEDLKQGATLKQTAKSLEIDTSDIKGSYHGALFDCCVTFRILHKFRRVLSMPSVVKLLTGD